MTLTSFLLLLLIAGVCGAIGQAFAGFTRGGCLTSIVVGFVGAFIGLWMADALGLPTMFVVDVDGFAFPVVWSILGGGALVAVLGLIRGR